MRRFRLSYRLILREKELHFNVGVYNPSKDVTFSCHLLLHTYFKCPDVRRCQITGLQGCTFVDKVPHFPLNFHFFFFPTSFASGRCVVWEELVKWCCHLAANIETT